MLSFILNSIIHINIFYASFLHEKLFANFLLATCDYSCVFYSTFSNRRTVFPSRSTVSFHIYAGRTQVPPSPYSARYTTIGSVVSEWRAMCKCQAEFSP